MAVMYVDDVKHQLEDYKFNNDNIDGKVYFDISAYQSGHPAGIIIINKRYYNPSSQYSTGSDTFINAIKDIVALFSNNHSILLISINNVIVREIPNIGRFDINYQTYNIEY